MEKKRVENVKKICKLNIRKAFFNIFMSEILFGFYAIFWKLGCLEDWKKQTTEKTAEKQLKTSWNLIWLISWK